MSNCRLNFTGGQYFDSQDVKVLTQQFGNISSLADLSDIFPAGSDANPIEYFTDRGYTVDVNIRAAAYDWRLGAGKNCYFCDL